MQDLKKPNRLWIDNFYNQLVLEQKGLITRIVRITISEEDKKILKEVFIE